MKTIIKRLILNIYLVLKYILKYRTFDFFNYIAIEFNTDCNASCSYCPNSRFSRGHRKMAINTYKEIINQLKEISFSGLIDTAFYGEPLLHKDLESFIAYGSKELKHAKLRIITNGDFLTINRYKTLVKAGAKIFLVTTHNEKGALNASKLTKFLKVNPMWKRKITIQKFTINSPLYNRGGLVKNLNNNYDPRCLDPDNFLTIDYQGNVLLCCNDYFSENIMGNISKTNLVDIWKTTAFKEIRKNHRKGVFSKDICIKCVGKDGS